MSVIDSALQPLQHVIAWLLAQGVTLLTAAGLSATGGLTWIVAIVIVVGVVRVALLPLWWRQLRAARAAAAMAPRLRVLQQSYRGRTDRASMERLAQEQAALRREHGAGLLGCLPMLLQSPVFFALFRVLQGVAHDQPIGALTHSLVDQANAATVFGAHLSDAVLAASSTAGQVVPALVVLAAAAIMFLTQRLQRRNTVAVDPSDPMARVATLSLVIGPGAMLISGLYLPLGVVIYLLSSGIWTLAQHIAGMRWWPNPGTEAARQWELRREVKSTAAPNAAHRGR